MLDKIHLYTSDFEVAKNAHLKIVPLDIDNATHEQINPQILWLEGNTPIVGKLAYNNDYGANITIKHGRLTVTYNPSTMVYGNNYFSASQPQINDTIQQVKCSLSEIGISVNVDTCKLSRIDLCRNIETEHPFKTYLPALELITPKWMPRKDPMLRDGYYLKANGSIQYCMYDKIRELRDKQVDLNSLGIHAKYVSRSEIRLIKNRSVNTHLKIDTIAELNTEEHFHYRLEVYRDIMTNRFFRINNNKHKLLNHENDRALICSFRNRYPNKAVEMFIIHKQITGSEALSIDYISDLMVGLYGKTTINAKENQLIELSQNILYNDNQNTTKQVSYPDLLNELHSKIVA